MSESVVRDPYAALRLPAFRFYASAWTLAVIGQQIQSVAVGYDLYQRTGNPLVLGLVGLVQAIPVIGLAMPAGQLADRFDRKKILMISQFGAAMASLGLVFCSLRGASANTYYLLLFLDAVANAIGWPARSAIVPSLVPMQTLTNAITWNSSFFQFASVTGPAIGGLILIGSVTTCYGIACAAALWYVIAMLFVKTRGQEKSREPITIESLVAGVRFVFQQKIILATITLDLFAVLLGGAVYLLPAVQKDILHVGPWGLGLLRSAPAVGAISMALILTHLPPMKRAGITLLWAVAGFGIATIIFGLSRNLALSVVALALTGAFDNISVVVRHTLVQVLTPDEMRGRVSAVNNVFIGASNEVGGFESGLTARLFGVTASIVAGGIGTLLVVAGVAKTFPQIRKLGALHDVKPMEAMDQPVANETADVPK